MVVSLFDSRLYGPLFGEEELVVLFSERQDIDRMIAVERALARVQGRLGVIPAEAARDIDEALAYDHPIPAAIAEGTAAAGVPVPSLVTALRAKVPNGHGQWLHWGATSQDIVDTAQMIALRQAEARVSDRVGDLVEVMRRHAGTHARLPMAARTRGQIATPITFGVRVAQWAAPLIEALADRPAAAFRVQFGGASGANTAVAPHGPAIATALAAELELADGPPWHSNRRPFAAIADWHLGIATALAKMAEDLILMLRPEVGEVRASKGGGSSTMPHKANPVEAEAIVTLSEIAHTLRAGLGRPHREERDGAAWALEWVFIPQMIVATGAALRHAQHLMETLEPVPERMQATLRDHPGVMAEAASFALARHMDRTEAQTLVKAALADDRPLAEALASRAPVPLDWAEILSPDQVIPACVDLIDQIFAGPT